MILALKPPLFSVSAVDWQSCCLWWLSYRWYNGQLFTGAGSSLPWNPAAPSQVGLKWDWRTAPGGTRWLLHGRKKEMKMEKSIGPACHLLWPPVSFLSLNKELDLDESLIQPPNVLLVLCRLCRPHSNTYPLRTTWMNDTNLILIPSVFHVQLLHHRQQSRENCKFPVTQIIHSFNYEPVPKMSGP